MGNHQNYDHLLGYTREPKLELFITRRQRTALFESLDRLRIKGILGRLILMSVSLQISVRNIILNLDYYKLRTAWS